MKKYIYFILFFSLKGETISPSLFSWFSALKLSQAGGGSLIITPTSRFGNAANSLLGRRFSTSFILYPANIQAQSVALSIPKEDKLIIAAINHLSYGTFQGFDEHAISTENYSSSDTWLRIGYSNLLKSIPIRYGIVNQLLLSSLEDYNFNHYYCSLGFIWELEKYKMDVGFSVNDILLIENSFNNFYENSHLKYNLAIRKELAYLPLQISIDYLNINSSNIEDYFISGIFSISKNFTFSGGTSTKKYSQNTNQSVTNTILGSSGIGINYRNKEIAFSYGLYFYGTGGWTNGLDLSINF